LPLLKGAVVDIEEQFTNAASPNRARTGLLVPDLDSVNWENMVPPE